MRLNTALAMLTALSAPAFAETTRELDAHEHGTSQLDIAIEGGQVSMALRAPGADIVGFEYKATDAKDVEAIEAALGTLAKPLTLFVVPDAAGCSVTQSEVSLLSDEDEHEHDEHAETGHDHDDHADAKHDDHDHDAHAEAERDEHDHEEHAQEAGAQHTEFEATYALTCANPDAMTSIRFAYFDAFTGAQELDVQIATDAGAAAFEITRDRPDLDLGALF